MKHSADLLMSSDSSRTHVGWVLYSGSVDLHRYAVPA